MSGVLNASRLQVQSAAIGQHFSLCLLRFLLNQPGYDPSMLVCNNIVTVAMSTILLTTRYQSISTEDQRKLHHRCAEWYTDDIVMQCQQLIKAQHPEALDKIIPAIRFLIKGYNFERAREFVALALELPQIRKPPKLIYELIVFTCYRLMLQKSSIC